MDPSLRFCQMGSSSTDKLNHNGKHGCRSLRQNPMIDICQRLLLLVIFRNCSHPQKLLTNNLPIHRLIFYQLIAIHFLIINKTLWYDNFVMRNTRFNPEIFCGDKCSFKLLIFWFTKHFTGKLFNYTKYLQPVIICIGSIMHTFNAKPLQDAKYLPRLFHNVQGRNNQSYLISKGWNLRQLFDQTSTTGICDLPNAGGHK